MTVSLGTTNSCCGAGLQPGPHFEPHHSTKCPVHMRPSGPDTEACAQGPTAGTWLSQEAEGELRVKPGWPDPTSATWAPGKPHPERRPHGSVPSALTKGPTWSPHPVKLRAILPPQRGPSGPFPPLPGHDPMGFYHRESGLA